uniref:Granulins domain-containing protein n=1 Tax=Stegastes partitus TaxID=144197 RepID=A0A3B4ZXT6_9TELE
MYRWVVICWALLALVGADECPDGGRCEADTVTTVMCKDGQTECPDETTCCEAPEGKWGCCPMPKAVCCADGSHCCPHQYKCDESKTSCIRGEVEIPWYTKIPADTSDQADLSAVQCDDGHQCPEHTTCCKLVTGQWGCCPLENVSDVCRNQ